MTTIIGLSGKKKSGKNTVSKIISTLTNLSIRELAFADCLKEEVAKACGVNVDYLEAHKDNFRLILQGWGTDYKRKLVRDSYWCDKLATKLTKAIAEDIGIVIITDVRFINEYNFINEFGGALVRVSRDNVISGDEHPSETALDKIHEWHHIILNTTTIDDLIPQIKELLIKLKIPIK